MFEIWDSLDNKGKVGCLGLITLAIGILFWIPMTRAAILFILPLGSGIDDLIFLAFAGFGLIMLAFRLIMK